MKIYNNNVKFYIIYSGVDAACDQWGLGPPLAKKNYKNKREK